MSSSIPVYSEQIADVKRVCVCVCVCVCVHAQTLTGWP